jgi:spore maturation protein CgeB
MDILLIGEFLPTRLEVSYNRAFESLGLGVRVFDTGQANRLFTRGWEYLINKKLLNVLRGPTPDLILVFKGFFLWPKTIEEIKRKNKCLVFCFNADNPFNLSTLGSSNRNILGSIPYYDCYFSFNHDILEQLKKQGAQKAGYLAFGFDAELHFPVKPTCKEEKVFASDLVFVGNWDKERERWLGVLKDSDLGIWGERYWARHCKDRDLRRKWRGQVMYASNFSKVLNSSKISLNILRLQNKGSHNMRTFETPACGVFVLSERSPEIEGFFKEDKEIVFFSTPEELKEKARYYLTHPQEREDIAKAGYQRCLSSGYSYTERARNILEVFNKLS